MRPDAPNIPPVPTAREAHPRPTDRHRKCLDYAEEDWRAFDCAPDCPAWSVLVERGLALVKIREGIQQLRDTFDAEHPTADDELAGLRIEEVQGGWLRLTAEDVAHITTVLRGLVDERKV
jgi:hypothetical protein